MSQQVITITLAEAQAVEEGITEAQADEGFVPSAPLTAAPAAYAAGTEYAKGALVTEGTQVYRSQKTPNKGNEPKADANFANWAPVSVDVIPLQNAAFGGTSYVSGG